MARVLIVDDHLFIRRGIQNILKPYTEWELCGEAGNGEEAVKMAGELRPDVIIMDVSMPGMNGLEATRAIRKNLPGTRILLLTLHDSKELVRSAFRFGASGYLLKSDTDHELIQALNVVLGDGIYVSPNIDAEFVKQVLSDPDQTSFTVH